MQCLWMLGNSKLSTFSVRDISHTASKRGVFGRLRHSVLYLLEAVLLVRSDMIDS